MNIAILGLGRLGQSLKEALERAGHTLCFTTNKPLTPQGCEKLAACELVYILVPPKALLNVVERVASLGVPTVIGTTGWRENQVQVVAPFKAHHTPMLYGANFSPSIFLMQKSLELFLQTSNKIEEQFSLTGVERHHKHKVDAPSGTATLLHEKLAPYSRVAMSPFAFERVGEEKGFHEVTMENKGNVLSWSHKAKDRSIFAKGALLAGVWLVGKQGIHTFEDYMETLL